MKRFSRCALILIIVTLLATIGGYAFVSSTTAPMYSSTAKVIVTPGEKNEASVRATDGGLVKDFEVVFSSSSVITAAQKTAGTSEDIAGYLTVKTVPNSNIVELTVTNPDQSTAKTYVDAVAKNVSKTASIVSVEAIQVLEYGTESNVAFKPDVLKNTGIIAGIVAALCLIVELIVVFVLNAFKDDSKDEEAEYERRFGNMMAANYMLSYNQNKPVAENADANMYDAAAGNSAELDAELDNTENAEPKNVYGNVYNASAAPQGAYDADYADDDDEEEDFEDERLREAVKEAVNAIYDDVPEAEAVEDDVLADDVNTAAANAAANAATAAETAYTTATGAVNTAAANAATAAETAYTAATGAVNTAAANAATAATAYTAALSADYEAAATKEEEGAQKEKTSKRGKKESKSSSEVLGTIRK